MRTTTILMVLTMVMSFTGAALAVDPPGLMNYQGVLRDADDNPLDGTYDMVFRFYDDADPGDPENEIFVDEHLVSGTGAVTVTGGLFDVVLGSGDYYDGSGPGDHPHIYYLFGLHETVYLEVQVGAEILQPRMQVVSAPYAIHAAVLGGHTPSDFINTGSEEQEKTGLLRALGGIDFGGGAHDDLTAADVTGLTAGPGNYADFLHSHNYVDNADTVDGKHANEFAEAAHGHSGSDIIGPVSEASNADTVDGKHANEFIDTSSTPQTKSGTLYVDAALTGSIGVHGKGSAIGGYFLNQDGTGYAQLGDGDQGVDASGSDAGGHFRNSSSLGHHAYLAWKNEAGETFGVWGRAATSGGYFQNDDTMSKAWLARTDAVGDSFGVDAEGGRAAGHFTQSSFKGEAYLGYMDSASDGFGVWAEGTRSGGYFQNELFPTTKVNLGYVDPLDSTHHYGVWATGETSGGYFKDSNDSGYAFVGSFDEGISAHGDVQGGYFEDNQGTSSAHIAYGSRGVEARGDESGGYFEDSNNSGYARVGSGHRGILAYGDDCGGYFANNDGTGDAWLGRAGEGIMAYGNEVGGHFHLNSGLSEAYLAYVESGTGDIFGIWAEGTRAGAYFKETDTGAYAQLAYAGYGIYANSDNGAGMFQLLDGTAHTSLSTHDDTWGTLGIWSHGLTAGAYIRDNGDSGKVYLGYGDRGLWAAGSFSGGTFSDTMPATGVWSDLAMILGDPPTSYKITGSGQVSFVQNHPLDPDRVVVYSAPEGDETAVYTRGTARLVAGEARVTLGETFKWVTNPDVGLTAYLTPRGDCMGLYVEKLSTEEMTVRELGGGTGDVVFDYIVYGLRIGFEQSNVVQSKLREAPLAAPNLGEEFYAVRAAPEALTALGRFTRMTADVRGVAPEELDLGGATALREAIRASDWKQIGMEPIGNGAAGDPAAGAAPTGPATGGAVDEGTGAALDPTAGEEPERESLEPASPFAWFPVSEQVEVGDLLVLDGEQPGQLRRADRAGDPNVVGIVAEESWTVDGQLQAAVALYGLASVKVDASHGVILAGDLLATSPTPGHAGLALVPTPGTVIGKALEPLESGTGFIRILVMPR